MVCLCRRIPYVVALKHRHGTCAALLNPKSAEPLVWPSPLKVISELNPEAKALLEQALMDANREREKNILKGSAYSLPSPSHSDGVDDNISEVLWHPLNYANLEFPIFLDVHLNWVRVWKYSSLEFGKLIAGSQAVNYLDNLKILQHLQF